MIIKFWRCMVCWEIARDHYWRVLFGTKVEFVCKKCKGVCEAVRQ